MIASAPATTQDCLAAVTPPQLGSDVNCCKLSNDLVIHPGCPQPCAHLHLNSKHPGLSVGLCSSSVSKHSRWCVEVDASRACPCSCTSGIAGTQTGTDLIWKGHLRTVMQWAQGCHWLVEIHVKEVCGQLQRYGNEREQAICQATYGIHVGLYGSLVPRQKPLQHSLLLQTVDIHYAVMLARHTRSPLEHKESALLKSTKHALRWASHYRVDFKAVKRATAATRR